MADKYLFIDGGFLRTYVREMKERIEPEAGKFEVNYGSIWGDYTRAFFYDAYPEWSPNVYRDETAYNEAMKEKEEFFSGISALPNFHVRPALTKRGKKK